MEIKGLYNLFLSKPKSDIREHLATLKDLGKNLVVTEFGVRWAESTTAWLLGIPKKFTCYDIKVLPRLKTYLPIFEKWAKDNNIDFKFIQADVLTIDIEETDILFIDTFHVYNQLKRELELFHNKVRKYIVLHDTETYGNIGEDGSKPGLMQAISEFVSETEWKIKKIYKNNNGLVILEKKNNV